MRRPARWVGLLVAIAASGWGSAGQAQPTIPRHQIPQDLPAEVKQQIEGLYSSDAKQRASAAGRLVGGSAQAGAVIPFLIAMLPDNAVLYDEAELQRRSLRSSYARAFSYPNTPGEDAAEAMARIGRSAGKPVMDALMGPLNSKDATVRANAIRALGEMVWLMGPEQRQSTGTDRAVEPLIGALAAKDAKSRKCAAVVLKCLGSPRAVEPLTAALRDDPSPEVRAAAAEALGAAKDPRPIGLLTATLENPSEPVEVRVSAAGALGSIADRRAVEPLIRALKDKDPLIRAAALTVADIIPDYRLLRPLLVDALRDPEWRVRDRATRAAGALGKLKDPAAFEVLMTALHDEYPNVRAAATQSLVELKDPRAVPPLAVVLREDDNSYVRWHAAIALEQFEDLRAVGPLTAALKDEDELVRTTARRALEKIKKATQSRQI